MKYQLTFALILSVLISSWGCTEQGDQDNPKPDVFIFTDINIDKGDPDDRQSLIHLLWYSNELNIKGIVPDRFDAGGYEACMLATEAYSDDYKRFEFDRMGYPKPEIVKSLYAKNKGEGERNFIKAVESSNGPLYVLIWGNMISFRDALKNNPEIADKIRIITIGTGRKYGPQDEVAGEDCNAVNWNGPGRNDIYENPEYDNLWWLELNWTYNGMFSGEGPKEMFTKLSQYGKMGEHMKFVTKAYPWAQYFRVGDTPTVLYLIDPTGNPNDPRVSSWAGKFIKPFPDKRENYYTDFNGDINWDYEDPCNTWQNRVEMYHFCKGTLEKERPEMYLSLLNKLEKLYNSSE
jgi:hypothetical protein